MEALRSKLELEYRFCFPCVTGVTVGMLNPLRVFFISQSKDGKSIRPTPNHNRSVNVLSFRLSLISSSKNSTNDDR